MLLTENMKMLILAMALMVTTIANAESKALRFDLDALEKFAAQGQQFALSQFALFEWDHVHIFAPYTAPAQIKQIVGQSVNFPHSEGEGYCLLVFAKGGKVVAATEIARRIVDFAALRLPASFDRDKARFEVERGADGWRKIKKG